MRLTSKILLLAVALVAVVLAVRHGGIAMQASLPKDMPENAHFLQSGYDVNTNEAKGNWIACRVDSEQGVNWCRVTDAHGMVVYEGNYLPVDSSSPVPESELKIVADSPSKLWVNGPVESSPVPVIKLANGRLLVPSADRGPLAERWKIDPSEYDQIMDRNN
ncbi:hypothetical protein [Granulicella tundricola]|uniref:Uncharacterized protein n=1 Tax=Granulicella tundricola (strain ATCC BAA-1859 / DSM 23138 / MP5ACTX9) TaxID=1198114 RepID=E8X217_GRATM|nr:hypothetical protein [Granulicella tundricola]ADW70260.1 hypothetical protein AciX9_3249 [Granulicella tundricola MP5ACTX9]